MTYPVDSPDNGGRSGGGVGGSTGNTGISKPKPAPAKPSSGGSPAPSVASPSVSPISAQRIADVLKGGTFTTATTATLSRFLSDCISVASGFGISYLVPVGMNLNDSLNLIRSSIVNATQRASAVAVEASSRGFLLPDDPFPFLARVNANRQLFDSIGVTSQTDREIVVAAVDLVKVAIARDAGRISFNSHLPAAQLASFEISLDGISKQTGDPLIDILGYQPDADYIKRKQALDSLSKLDFSKRKPYMLFTADVITGGRRQSGTVICWVKMRDASGYVISKRDVFSGINFQSSAITSEGIQQVTQRLLSDGDFNQILSFYDWIDDDDVVAFVDLSSRPGTLYSYSISGIQNRAPANSSFFDTALSSLYLSPAQAETLRFLISEDVRVLSPGGNIDSVSPYPALSQVVFGDPGYGWILAGCNVFGSKRRGDSSDETRSFSYIGSKASSIIAAASAGRMFVPNDINQIHTAVDSGVSSYGISQTILSVLDGTGVTLFAARKDDPLGFTPTQQSLESVSRGLAKILSVIDPQTATLDPHVLAASLSTPINSAQQPRYSSTSVPATSPIKVPDVSTLDSAFGSEILDLTTYSGISRLMQIIRTIYDFYPGALV